MLDVLTRYWWAVVLRGAAAIIFGLMAVIWPDITVIALVALFGAYALVDGVFALGAAIFGNSGGVRSSMFGPGAIGGRQRLPRGWLVVEGIAGILIGIVTFAWPGVTTLVLLWMIAAWALVTGVLKILAAVRLQREIEGEWLLALSGALSVIFGILLAAWPASGALAVVVLIGVYAMVFGVVLVALGLRLRRRRREDSLTPVRRPATA